MLFGDFLRLEEDLKVIGVIIVRIQCEQARANIFEGLKISGGHRIKRDSAYARRKFHVFVHQVDNLIASSSMPLFGLVIAPMLNTLNCVAHN